MSAHLRFAIGLLLAFSIGAACHWVEIPVPAPTALEGGLLLLSMTLGFLTTDKWLNRKAENRESGNNQDASRFS